MLRREMRKQRLLGLRTIQSNLLPMRIDLPRRPGVLRRDLHRPMPGLPDVFGPEAASITVVRAKHVVENPAFPAPNARCAIPRTAAVSAIVPMANSVVAMNVSRPAGIARTAIASKAPAKVTAKRPIANGAEPTGRPANQPVTNRLNHAARAHVLVWTPMRIAVPAISPARLEIPAASRPINSAAICKLPWTHAEPAGTDASLDNRAAMVFVPISAPNRIARNAETLVRLENNAAKVRANRSRNAKTSAASARNVGAGSARRWPITPHAVPVRVSAATVRALPARNAVPAKIRVEANVAPMATSASAISSSNHAVPKPGSVTVTVAPKGKSAATECVPTIAIAAPRISSVAMRAAKRTRCAVTVPAPHPASVIHRSGAAPTRTSAARKAKCVSRIPTPMPKLRSAAIRRIHASIGVA